jgi:fumarate hydratase subunit alpha
MRIVSRETIFTAIHRAIRDITYNNDPRVIKAINLSLDTERDELVADVLSAISTNNEISPQDRIPLCQDTGSTIILADIGNEVLIPDASLQEIADLAAAKAQQDLPLRASIVQEPLFERNNTGTNSPAIVHIRQVPGDGLRLRIAQKGGGAENMSFLIMFSPTASIQTIRDTIIGQVIETGSRACPPLVIGIGIGGNFERCAYLAKSALFEPLGRSHPDLRYAALEQDILQGINDQGVGAQGMGGNLSALAVHILFEPCHIASLPVAVNLQCHAHRHIEITL